MCNGSLAAEPAEFLACFLLFHNCPHHLPVTDLRQRDLMENRYDQKNLLPLLEHPRHTVRREVTRGDDGVGRDFSRGMKERFGEDPPERERMTIHFLGEAGDSFGEGLARGITFVADAVGAGGCARMNGGRAVILSFPGEDFGRDISGGCAYAYDPEGRLLGRTDAWVRRLPLDSREEKELKGLLREHVAVTDSPRARELLEKWPEAREAFVLFSAKI